MISTLYFNNNTEFVKVDLTKVAYVEADGNYCHVVFNNGHTETVSVSLLQMQGLISKTLAQGNRSHYVRVGRKFIINTSTIVRVNVVRKHVVLCDHDHAPMVLEVPKESARQLKQLLVNQITNDKK